MKERWVIAKNASNLRAMQKKVGYNPDTMMNLVEE
jgi:hypothetical protein